MCPAEIGSVVCGFVPELCVYIWSEWITADPIFHRRCLSAKEYRLKWSPIVIIRDCWGSNPVESIEKMYSHERETKRIRPHSNYATLHWISSTWWWNNHLKQVNIAVWQISGGGWCKAPKQSWEEMRSGVLVNFYVHAGSTWKKHSRESCLVIETCCDADKKMLMMLMMSTKPTSGTKWYVVI